MFIQKQNKTQFKNSNSNIKINNSQFFRTKSTRNRNSSKDNIKELKRTTKVASQLKNLISNIAGMTKN